MLKQLGTHSIGDFYTNCVENANVLNIATGFITNDSVAELNHILDFHEFDFKINLLIGMHYIEGFTELQYNSVRKLNGLLQEKDAGNIYLSKNALFHGKMYSFMKNDKCIGAFLGSSNLGSFLGTSTDLIEADTIFFDREGQMLNDKILKIIELLGTPFSEIPIITRFKHPEQKIFTDNINVKEISSQELDLMKKERTGAILRIPLKPKLKSNLNTYFGAGKIKGKYSRRNWYEVELILNVDIPNRDILPWAQGEGKKKSCQIVVVTEDGYQFDCSCQGDYGKNFRSSNDLAILGRWIKGHMENVGALTVGEPVTQDVLKAFGHSFIALQRSLDNKWFMWFDR